MPITYRTHLFTSLCLCVVAGGCADPGAVVASSTSGPGCGVAPCEAPNARSGDIAAGYRHSCWIDAGGALSCWGSNIAGEIGDGTTESRPVPALLSLDARWKAVATGGAPCSSSGDEPVVCRHTCAIRDDGALHCWGSNDGGQLGLEGLDAAASPVAVDEGHRYVAIGAGGASTCAARDDGALFCWGGVGTWGFGFLAGIGPFVPTQVGAISDIERVSVGGTIACAVRSDGVAYCWPSVAPSSSGGAPPPPEAPIPIEIGDGNVFQRVAAGGAVACGIEGAPPGPGKEVTPGALWCWDTEWAEWPVEPGSLWVDVSVGDKHACAVRSDGELACWGNGAFGKLGNGSQQDVAAPALVGGDTWTRVAAGTDHTCAVRLTTKGADAQESVHCWGNNFAGQLGDGTTAGKSVPSIVGPGFSDISLGLVHTVGVGADGSLLLWGSSAITGILTSLDASPVPVSVPSQGQWVKVDAGRVHRCALNDAGLVMCWGGGSNGQLGDGEGVAQDKPVVVAGGGSYVGLSAGGDHTCGVRSDGSLWCWGEGMSGEIGDGGGATRLTPSHVAEGTSWLKVSAGGFHTCGIRADGTLWCWGGNASGQVGVSGGATTIVTPVQVGNKAGWVDVSAGFNHSCAVHADGSLSCWGAGAHGALGSGTGEGSPEPILISGTKWIRVEADSGRTCALQEGSILQCWGLGSDGQVGDGAFEDRYTPTLVGAGTAWTDFALGPRHTCAIDDGSVLSCWGSNELGELGDGTAWRSTPAPIVVP